jgi:hypothetical protein
LQKKNVLLFGCSFSILGDKLKRTMTLLLEVFQVFTAGVSHDEIILGFFTSSNIMCQFGRFDNTSYNNPEYGNFNRISVLCKCEGKSSERLHGLDMFENRVLVGTVTEECEFA